MIENRKYKPKVFLQNCFGVLVWLWQLKLLLCLKNKCKWDTLSLLPISSCFKIEFQCSLNYRKHYFKALFKSANNSRWLVTENESDVHSINIFELDVSLEKIVKNHSCQLLSLAHWFKSSSPFPFPQCFHQQNQIFRKFLFFDNALFVNLKFKNLN